MSLNLFDLPTQRHRPIVQWIWDADPDEAQMRKQLELIKTAGFGGVCLQPMPDNFRPNDFRARMKIPYLGEAFFAAIQKAVAIAKELGLLVWLYDEGGWPSGQACGLVLKDHPHLEGQTLVQESGRFIVEHTGLPDALKLQAIERFIEVTHEGYRKAVGEHFGQTVETMFSDELKVPGVLGTDRVPWTDDMASQFREHAGYDLEPVLGLLFEGALARKHPAAQVMRVRRDFGSLCVKLFIERCIKPQEDWCHQNNLLFNGHLAGEHDIARHPALFGDYMAVMRHFDMPGVDTIWRQIWPGHAADFALFAGSARAVHQRAFAMSETGAVYGRDMTAASLKWLYGQQIIRGINRFTQMSLPLSGGDETNISALSTEGLPWLAHQPWAHHVSLLSALTSQGKVTTQAAVLYPNDDLHARGGDGPGTIAQAITEHLMHLPGGCAYIDEPAIIQAAANASEDCTSLTCGDLTTHCLLVAGDSLISQSLATALHQLTNAGLRLITVGEDRPYVLKDDQTIERLTYFELVSFDALEANPALAATAKDQPGWYEGDHTKLRSMHRYGQDWQMLLVSNESNEPASFKLNLSDTALRFEVDTKLVPRGQVVNNDIIHMKPNTVQAILWGAVDAPQWAKQAAGEQTPLALNTQPWQIVQVTGQGQDEASPEQTHGLTQTPIAPWASHVGKHFSGQVVYESKLTITEQELAVGRRLFVDLGEVQHTAQVHVNDKLVGTLAWSPYRFDLTDSLQTGSNIIRVTVANTSANYFWEPGHVAQRKAQGKWNVYNQRTVERCTPTLDGGLIGPIQWLSQSE